MSTKDEGYNGWANYETWLVALWISNENPWHNELCDLTDRLLAREFAPRYPWETKEMWVASELATHIQESIEANVPDDTGLYSDLLTGALRVVMWVDIAKHYVDEAVRQKGRSP